MNINQSRLIRCFTELVSIDAPSYDERVMANELTRRLSALGLTVEEDNAGTAIGGTAGNLIVKVPGTVAAPPLLFSSHMDTVEPSRGKRAILHEDGRITSAGDTVLGADDAAGLAALLEALTVITESQLPHRPLELVFPVAEESYTIGSHQLDFSRLAAKEAYVLDMSAPVGAAALKAPSILYFKATFQGRAAHAGMAPEEGIHAIKIAADAISHIKTGVVDADTTVNIGTISGGLATNIVPERCTIEGEVRGFRHDIALQRLAEVRHEFQAAAARFGGSVEVEHVIRTVAYSVAPDTPVVQRHLRCCAKNGIPGVLTKTFGGSDNNTFAEHGISGIVLASTAQKSHSTEEYTTVDDLTKLAELALSLMLDTE